MLIWEIGYDDPTAVPFVNGTYNAGELNVTVTIDEDGKTVREYKDKDGLLILSKIQIVGGQIDMVTHSYFSCTYYVYDNLKRLRYVTPPKAVAAIDGTWDLSTVKELCFSNFYDGRGRLVEKKIPGKAVEEFVYDKRDRLVMSRGRKFKATEQSALHFL